MTKNKSFILVLALFVTMSAWVGIASADSGFAKETAWEGEYYDNYWFAGEPALIRDDAKLAFWWGEGAPIPALSADHNSIKWRKEVTVDAPTTVRFTASADDEMRLVINSQPVLKSKEGVEVSAEVQLKQGKNWLYVEYKEKTGNAHINLTYKIIGSEPAKPTTTPTPSPTPEPTPEPLPITETAESDWQTAFYSNINWEGKPAVEQSYSGINLSWGYGAPFKGMPADNFSTRATKTISVSAETIYELTLLTTDRARVMLDGKPLLSIDGSFYRPNRPGEQLRNVISFLVTPGIHTLTVEHADVVGSSNSKAERYASLSVLLLPVEQPTEYDGDIPDGNLILSKKTTTWQDTINVKYSIDNKLFDRVYFGSQTWPSDGSYNSRYQSGDMNLNAYNCQFEQRYVYMQVYVGRRNVIVDSATLEHAPDEWFFSLKDKAAQQALGNPCETSKNQKMAFQRFERGAMVWLENPQGAGSKIYVLTGDADKPTGVMIFNDYFKDGMPINDPMIVPPAGLIQPEYGFGKLWRENLNVRSAIGWAVHHPDDSTSSYAMTRHSVANSYRYQSGTEFFLLNGRLLRIDQPARGNYDNSAPTIAFVAYDLRY